MPKTGIEITETDLGTKEKTKKAAKRVEKFISKDMSKRLREWWNKVLATAKLECPVDTGTLRHTIRKTKQEVKGTYHEKQVGVEFLSEKITAGGLKINPKTGKLCDYAQAVHDGTSKMLPRPFLKIAVVKNEAELRRIADAFLKKVAREWSRD